MLGFVRGKIISKSLTGTTCVVLSGTVGYELTVSNRLYESLRLDQEVSLWLHTHVREDILALYGFPSDEEKSCFRILLSVNGLGPKHALSLLSEHGWERLVQSILSKDTSTISKAHGVGKTLAQRIVLDLSGKLEKFALLAKPLTVPLAETVAPADTASAVREDLVSALSNLGYPPNHIRNVVDRLFEEAGRTAPPFETALKRALSELSGRTSNVVEGGRHA